MVKLFYFLINIFNSSDTLELDPEQGELIPMDFVEIKLTLTSSVVPSVYAGEIKCHILRDKRDYDEEELSKIFLFSNF